MKKSILYLSTLLLTYMSYGQNKHMRITTSGHNIIKGLDNMVNTTGLQPFQSVVTNNQGSIDATVEIGSKSGGINLLTCHVAYADMLATEHKAYNIAASGSFGFNGSGVNCNLEIMTSQYFTLSMGRWVKNPGSAYVEPNYCRLIWSYDPLLPSNISNGGTLNAFNYYYTGGNSVTPIAAVGHHNAPQLISGCTYAPDNHSYNLWLYDMSGNSIKWSEVVDIISYEMVAQASDLPAACASCSPTPHHSTLQSNYNILHYPDGIKLKVKLANNTIIDVSMASNTYDDIKWKEVLSPCGTVDCNYISTIHDPTDASLITYVGPPSGFNGQLISYYNWNIDGNPYRTTTNSITVYSNNYGGISNAELTYEVDAGNCYILADVAHESVAIPHQHCVPAPPSLKPIGPNPPSNSEFLNSEFSNFEIDKTEPDFFTYPNPAENQFTIESINNQSYSFQLIDFKGTEVMIQSNISTTKHQVNTQKLTSGVYLLKINSNEKITSLKLIIK